MKTLCKSQWSYTSAQSWLDIPFFSNCFMFLSTEIYSVPCKSSYEPSHKWKKIFFYKLNFLLLDSTDIKLHFNKYDQKKGNIGEKAITTKTTFCTLKALYWKLEQRITKGSAHVLLSKLGFGPLVIDYLVDVCFVCMNPRMSFLVVISLCIRRPGEMTIMSSFLFTHTLLKMM